jgi:16S rRNA (cytosine967-C5)-methyltransferase
MTATARQVALRCLRRIDHEGAFANLVLAGELEGSGLDGRDRRFVTELVNGTTRMRRACDALVDRFVAKEPDPDVRTVLRLGAYQLHFAEVAAHAAVGETVALAPKRVRGFANAVLRSVARTPMQWPSDAVRLSYPDWLHDALVAELGEADALASMAVMNEPPPVSERSDGYVQDVGSQWVAASVPATDGDLVLDACAAPGGKATAIAARGAVVLAADLRPHRATLIAANVRRTGAHGVVPLVGDATEPPFRPETFQHVLVDAPCSGLGTLRRRADARWRIQPGDIDALAALQQRMLDRCAPLVRVGGTLTYSVCTLLAAESTGHRVPDGFEPISDVPPGVWRAFGTGWRVLPHDAGTDGMILLRYRRSS